MKRILLLMLIFHGCLVQGQNLAGKISERFEAYRTSNNRTKIILIFPQDKYFPGDTAFFAAYFLTEDGHFVGNSQIINLDLINDKGATVQQILFRVKDGVGANQLIIPMSAPQGNYTITAYNDFMRNYDRRFYFKKEICILNGEGIETDYSKNKPRITAEGGHLVQGVSNRIMIQTPGLSGARVRLIRDGGMELASESVDEFGTASIRFTPEKKASYHVEINEKKSPIPQTEDDGCSLQLFPNSTRSTLRLVLSSPPESIWRNQELVTVLTINGQLYYTAAFKQGNKETVNIPIPQTDFPEGLGLVSVIAPDHSLLASRHFYVPPISALQCKIQLASDTLSTNQKINVELSLKEETGKPFTGPLTVTVLNAALFPISDKTLSAAINFPSGMRVISKEFSYRKAAAFDNYLSQQAGDVTWSKVLDGHDEGFPGPPPLITLKGRAYFTDTQKPVPDSTHLVCYMQKNGFAFSDVANQGIVEFTFLDFFEKDNLFFFAESNGKLLENVSIQWLQDTLGDAPAPAWKINGQPDPYAVFLEKKRNIDRSFDFRPPTSYVVASSKFDSPLEERFKNAGKTINLQDYKLFPDMREMLHEVIPRLYYRKQGQEEIVRVVISDKVIKAKSSPVYVIDGKLTKSTSYFLSLSPADLISIQVVHEPKLLSPIWALGKNGIVFVKTKKGVGGSKIIESSIEITGLNPVIPFHPTTSISLPSYRRPDFRSTLYWNPAIKTDVNGKAKFSFITSDDTGKIKILVQGVAGTQWFSEEKEVTVVFDGHP